MRQADAGIFNLSPFRGVNADPGTAFELGFFSGLGKPVFAYTIAAEDLFARVGREFGARGGAGGEYCDAMGFAIENFGNADNLMLDGALHTQGRRVMRPDVSVRDLGDLAGFKACLREARVHFGF
jgi:nucleoside 2-deoxyribosyltransferase